MRRLATLLLLACSADPSSKFERQPELIGDSGGLEGGGVEGGGLEGGGVEGGEGGGDTDTAPPPPVDADGDGWAEGEDCDEVDPSVNPGAAERCDGLDQDCDGVADDGIPTDGAGCAEPAAPTWDDDISTVTVTIRTRDLDYAGTDDEPELCLSAGLCLPLNNEDYDDLERAAVDVFAFEGLSESKAAFDRLRIRTSTGDDAWYPDCAAVSVDGELIYCASVSGVSIGNTSSEVTSWTDPDGLHLECGGCFDSPLTHGPFVGAPLAGGARFWLRTDTARRVVLRLAPTATELAEAAPVSTFWTSEVDDFTGTTEVYGLAPGSSWAWDLEIEGLRYGPWTVQVPPADTDPTALRLAFGSCGRDSDQPIFSAIRELAPDLFLFIGDNHYGNTDDIYSHRQFYRDAHSIDQRAQLMQEAGVLAVWDDHDYTNNNEDGAAVGKEEALRAFEEYWANGSYGSEGEPGIWSATRWGQVGIWLLDDRYYRGLEDDIFGSVQTDWLLDSLEGSEATFKLVAMGSQWTSRGTSDSFAVYPEAQTAFREALVERGIEGVVLLSGDIHRSETRLLPGASGGYDLPELTSSPLATSPATCGSTSEVQDCYDDGSSFLSIDIDTSLADPELVVRIHQEDGDVVAEWTILRSELEL